MGEWLRDDCGLEVLVVGLNYLDLKSRCGRRRRAERTTRSQQ